MPRKKKSTVNEVMTESIKEILACEPMLSPNPIRNDPLMLKYNGDNARQVMEFCGSYHIACHPDKLQLFLSKLNDDGSVSLPLSIFINPGQSIVDRDGLLEVID